MLRMMTAWILGVAFLSLAPPTVRAQEKNADLNVILTGKLGDAGISAKAGRIPLELTFATPPDKADKDQKFSNGDYRFDLFDKDGNQVLVNAKRALLVTIEMREIVLKPGVVKDAPGVSVPPNVLKAGEEYYLLASIRNRSVLIKFKAAP